jgi:hypothetical protein
MNNQVLLYIVLAISLWTFIWQYIHLVENDSNEKALFKPIYRCLMDHLFLPLAFIGFLGIVIYFVGFLCYHISWN